MHIDNLLSTAPFRVHIYFQANGRVHSRYLYFISRQTIVATLIHSCFTESFSLIVAIYWSITIILVIIIANVLMKAVKFTSVVGWYNLGYTFDITNSYSKSMFVKNSVVFRKCLVKQNKTIMVRFKLFVSRCNTLILVRVPVRGTP